MSLAPRRFLSGIQRLAAPLLLIGGACSPNGSTNHDDTSTDDTSTDLSDDTGRVETLMEGVTTFYVQQAIDGAVVSREVLIHAPASLEAGTSYPVVVALHGAQGNNDSWTASLGPLVDDGLFVGVYPQGHEGYWALGPEPSTADDLAFLDAVMARLGEFAGLDLEHAYALGVSNGAGMAHRIAIERHHFVAIAAFVTSLTDAHQPDSVTAPVSVLQLMGMDDPLIPYEGGVSNTGHTFLPAEQSAAIWAEHAGCVGAGTLDVHSNGDRWLEWTDCPDGRRVRHIGIAGAEHSVPRDFEGGSFEFAWDFLSQQGR